MGRKYTGQPLNVGLTPKVTKPIDSRAVIDTGEDRFLAATWKEDDGNYYVYPGMLTVAADTGSIYIYIGRENSAEDIVKSSMWIATGLNIDIDTVLSGSSSNPVQNKVVKQALDGKQSTLVSGSNIKTVNNLSLLGGGNINIPIGMSDAEKASLQSAQERQDSAISATASRLEEQTAVIETLSSLYKNLMDNGLGTMQEYAIQFLEEYAVEGMSADMMTEGVIYVGLEPYDSGDGADNPEAHGGYVELANASSERGYVLMPSAVCKNGYVSPN